MNRKIFIMGAPNAGKSTYLAALWHKSISHDVTSIIAEMSGETNGY